MKSCLLPFLITACASAPTGCASSPVHDRQDAAGVRRAADRAINDSLKVESSIKQAADHAMYESRRLEIGP